jgi:hypothetical protein
MRSSLKLAIAAAVAVPTLLAFGVPAGASTATASVSASAAPAGVVNSVAAVKLSHTSIQKGPKFKPATLNAPGKAGKSCTKKTAGVLVANKTSHTWQVTSSGEAIGDPIPAGDGLYICYNEKGAVPPPATYVFGIAGKSKATLTVSFT